MPDSPQATAQAGDAVDIGQWRREFEASHYGVIRHAISADAAEVAARYLQILLDYYQPLFMFNEQQQSFGRYNDPLGESVLATVLAKIRRMTGLDLLPTYSFSRIYMAGGTLARHVDRPSCEVSATLLLASDKAWPIGVEVDGQDRAVDLDPGDLMVYRGCEVPHWRDQYAGERSAHIFLHFVESGGPHAHLVYDQRAGLGAPQSNARPLRDEALQQRLREDSRSRREEPGARMRRNEPCPCGSGRKYKHCHGAKP